MNEGWAALVCRVHGYSDAAVFSTPDIIVGFLGNLARLGMKAVIAFHN
jgi:hypothetical protein